MTQQHPRRFATRQIEIARRHRLRDAQDGRGTSPTATFPSGFPVLRIDHVFVTEGLMVRGIESPFDPRARAASDHLPLVVDLDVPGAGSAPAAP